MANNLDILLGSGVYPHLTENFLRFLGPVDVKCLRAVCRKVKKSVDASVAFSESTRLVFQSEERMSRYQVSELKAMLSSPSGNNTTDNFQWKCIEIDTGMPVCLRQELLKNLFHVEILVIQIDSCQEHEVSFLRTILRKAATVATNIYSLKIFSVNGKIMSWAQFFYKDCKIKTLLARVKKLSIHLLKHGQREYTEATMVSDQFLLLPSSLKNVGITVEGFDVPFRYSFDFLLKNTWTLKTLKLCDPTVWSEEGETFLSAVKLPRLQTLKIKARSSQSITVDRFIRNLPPTIQTLHIEMDEDIPSTILKTVQLKSSHICSLSLKSERLYNYVNNFRPLPGVSCWSWLAGASHMKHFSLERGENYYHLAHQPLDANVIDDWIASATGVRILRALPTHVTSVSLKNIRYFWNELPVDDSNLYNVTEMEDRSAIFQRLSSLKTLTIHECDEETWTQFDGPTTRALLKGLSYVPIEHLELTLNSTVLQFQDFALLSELNGLRKLSLKNLKGNLTGIFQIIQLLCLEDLTLICKMDDGAVLERTLVTFIQTQRNLSTICVKNDDDDEKCYNSRLNLLFGTIRELSPRTTLLKMDFGNGSWVLYREFETRTEDSSSQDEKAWGGADDQWDVNEGCLYSWYEMNLHPFPFIIDEEERKIGSSVLGYVGGLLHNF